MRSVFPVLIAIDQDNISYLDSHDSDQAYSAMHEHVLHQRFPILIGGYSRELFAKIEKLSYNNLSNKSDGSKAAVLSADAAIVKNAKGRLQSGNVPSKVAVSQNLNFDVRTTNQSKIIRPDISVTPFTFHTIG